MKKTLTGILLAAVLAAPAGMARAADITDTQRLQLITALLNQLAALQQQLLVLQQALMPPAPPVAPNPNQKKIDKLVREYQERSQVLCHDKMHSAYPDFQSDMDALWRRYADRVEDLGADPKQVLGGRCTGAPEA